MIRFEDIQETVEKHHPDADLEILRKAYIFSAVEHKGQVRASGEPYLVHPLEVAAILAEMRMDPICVAVGLLHDVLEDTLTTPERLQEYFGPDVLHIVEGVTKISQIPFATSEERQAETYRKMLLAMVDDIRVILVKLADRLHNMRTLQHLPEDRQKRIARETLDIYAPIAGRLGMAKIKNELEDLAFRYIDKPAYDALAQQVEDRRKQSAAFIEKIRGGGRPEPARGGNRGADRGPHQAPALDPAEAQAPAHRPRPGLRLRRARILVGSVADCYAALGVLHNTWRPVPGRIKDFIAMPRPNGYQSLHTSVISEDGHPFEVQIRTQEMHRIAEEGIAAHWKYKEGRTGVDKDDHAFSWLRQLLEWQQEVKDPHEFLNSLKLDLYPEEVYCFTPRGEVKMLPRGASPIDFAYAIHTEVGHQCVGARVNGKMVPLRYKLKNGDIVEILTSPGHKPSRDWLSFTVTNKAKAKIRHYLNTTEKQQALEIGRKHLERELQALRPLAQEGARRADAARDAGAGDWAPARASTTCSSRSATASSSVRQVLAKLLPPEKLAEPTPTAKPLAVVDAVKRLLRGDDRIKVKGTDDLLVYRAKCCNPIMGEPIVGYITRGKGVSVHSLACPNVTNLVYDPERRIAVEWESGAEGGYEVRLAVGLQDRPGALAAVTAALAAVKTDVRDAQVRTFDDKTASIELTVRISDKKHLDRVLKSVRGVSGVIDVARHSVPR